MCSHKNTRRIKVQSRITKKKQSTYPAGSCLLLLIINSNTHSCPPVPRLEVIYATINILAIKELGFKYHHHWPKNMKSSHHCCPPEYSSIPEYTSEEPYPKIVHKKAQTPKKRRRYDDMHLITCSVGYLTRKIMFFFGVVHFAKCLFGSFVGLPLFDSGEQESIYMILGINKTAPKYSPVKK